MFPVKLPLFVLLFFPKCAFEQCIKGTPKECQEAEFAPGSNLAGEGFDITKMERKGFFVLDMNQWKHSDQACTLCDNPDFENRKQKLPLSVEDWRAKHFCSAKVSSKVYKSSESLVESTTSSIENNWKVGLSVNMIDKSGSFMLVGTDSKLAVNSMEKTKSDKFSFTTQSVSCEYYSYRVSKAPTVKKEFLDSVNQLPKVYNPQSKNNYYHLIDTFGTHYITWLGWHSHNVSFQVKMGGKVNAVTSIRECEAHLDGIEVNEMETCLTVEASATVKATTISAENQHCKAKKDKTRRKITFSSYFNDRFTEVKGGQKTEPDLIFSANSDPSAYKEWLNSVPRNPDIISYSLDSLHELIPKSDPMKENLRSAISHYILEKGLLKSCTDPCKAGIKSSSREPCVCQCHNDPAVTSDCCPNQRGNARVKITILRAFNLYGDYRTATDAYVIVKLLGKLVGRTSVISNDDNPKWNMVLDMGDQVLSEVSKLKFEVWDEDNTWDDDLLGECERVLTAGINNGECFFEYGKFLFKWKVDCAPNLSGRYCQNYQSSPMNEDLKELYRSRHSHPIPKYFLQQMGVFVNESTSRKIFKGNKTQTFFFYLKYKVRIL
uniref:Perforin-1-like n=1 Tax=Oryzias melastigma TaxID=30732 RepID=A0A3B3DT96_ORYME